MGLSVALALAAAQAGAFGLDDVADKARELAGQSFSVPASNLPPPLRAMQYADYQEIRSSTEKRYWADEETPFELMFYHQGMHFDVPVTINEITATGVRPIEYDPAYFDFGGLELDSAALEGLGFAGFKVLYPLNSPDKQDELLTLLGASYFRALGAGQWYGLSGRGLAIDTALPSGEEFPRFSEFWVEYPEPDRRDLIIYALLDSPSVTGAYRMVLRPGDDTVLDIQARLFFRDAVDKLGIAPLTSMFLYGPNQPSRELNFRPAIHDSDGLAIHTGSGEWIWRPLNNPRHLSISTFSVENPRGFGLMQRARDFAHYQDLDDRYELRPGGWIEVVGDWGPGRVELVEIPTADETNDNIVAFWTPDQPIEPGQELALEYRMHFTMAEPMVQELAWVSQTRRSIGEIKQPNLIREPDGSIAFVVDFEGGPLAGLPEQEEVFAQVSVGENGELVGQEVGYNYSTEGRRLTLRLRQHDPARPVEVRAALVQGETTLSETWSYQVPIHE
ncbi:glucan biosynthesis protein G [Stutzerimonas tarimensis]|uniref:Glucans biosynthesis protein G n=1 Tax=Stutzerimonas tarimensis TaxID=1507735 RepID=A0ABV7T9E7_9GAMM